MANVWKIAPGRHAEDWQVFRRQGCIGLGWLRGSDYQSFRSMAQALRALEREHGKKAPGYGCGAAEMILRFVQEVKRSDVVVANDGYNRSSALALCGRVSAADVPRQPDAGPTTHRHHVREVQWVIPPVNLDGDRFFVQSTLWPLEAEKVGRIRQAYPDAYPDDSELRASLARVFGQDDRTDDGMNAALAAAERQLEEENAFDATGMEDARERVLSSIVRRRGQSRFRDRLLAAYHGRCAVTGCEVEAVLEAAHIIPYRGEQRTTSATACSCGPTGTPSSTSVW
jgi:hypothetical protein